MLFKTIERGEKNEVGSGEPQAASVCSSSYTGMV